MRSPIPYTLFGIWGAPTGEVFAAGSGGTILRGYRNGAAAVTPSSATISGNYNQVQLAAPAAAGGTPVAGVTYLWSSTDEDVATVDGDGLVTGLANGTATIMATAFGGAAATATVTVSLTQMPPTAVIDSPEHDTTLTLGETVTFLGTATDADGTIASHQWDFGDGSGASVEDPGAHTYASAGRYTVTYRVTDDDGATSPTARVVITVVPNQAPTAAITSPANGATFTLGETITFTGSGDDHEDGPLTGSSLVWTSFIDGQIGTGTSFTRDDLSAGTHNINLTATDSEGGTTTAGVQITVLEAGTIVPGNWHAPTEFGSLDFTVNPQGTAITRFLFSFADYECGSVSGSWTSETTGGTWLITERQFTFETSGSWYEYVLTGTFDETGTGATGTWDVTLQGTTCSGTWQGAPGP